MTALGRSLASLSADAASPPAVSAPPPSSRPLRVLGVDPGTRHVGLALCEARGISGVDAAGLVPAYAADVSPDEALERVRRWTSPRARGVDLILGAPERFVDVVVVELMGPWGSAKAMARDLRDTAILIGRFVEAVEARGAVVFLADRTQVKRVVCGRVQAKDGDVRTCLVNAYGGEDAMHGEKCSECKGRGFVGGKVRGRPCGACTDGWGREPSALGRLGLKADAHAWQALAAVAWWAETTQTTGGAR